MRFVQNASRLKVSSRLLGNSKTDDNCETNHDRWEFNWLPKPTQTSCQQSFPRILQTLDGNSSWHKNHTKYIQCLSVFEWFQNSKSYTQNWYNFHILWSQSITFKWHLSTNIKINFSLDSRVKKWHFLFSRTKTLILYYSLYEWLHMHLIIDLLTT